MSRDYSQIALRNSILKIASGSRNLRRCLRWSATLVNRYSLSCLALGADKEERHVKKVDQQSWNMQSEDNREADLIIDTAKRTWAWKIHACCKVRVSFEELSRQTRVCCCYARLRMKWKFCTPTKRNPNVGLDEYALRLQFFRIAHSYSVLLARPRQLAPRINISAIWKGVREQREALFAIDRSLARRCDRVSQTRGRILRVSPRHLFIQSYLVQSIFIHQQ